MTVGTVVAVHRNSSHSFSKESVEAIQVIEGVGVKGDAHSGRTVQHLSRVKIDPTQPNLRQVHLIHSELFEEVAQAGFDVRPGALGENITTAGIDLLALGRDTLLHIGPQVVLRVTGLRNPCAQIDTFAPGLLKQVAVKTDTGIVRKAGIMTVALTGGKIRAGDIILTEPPSGPLIPLERV